MQMVKRMRRAVAVLSATALVASPLLLSPTGVNASVAAASSSAAMPQVKATLTRKTIRMSGVDRLRAGRVKLSVSGKGVVEFLMFDEGYDVADFAKDVGRFESKNDIKALRRALANTTILGGVAGGGTGTVVFPKAGSYTPFSLGERGPVFGKAFTLRGPVRSARTPRTDGRIIAKNGPSWGGASHLPMKGRFLFKNKGNTGVPHFVLLQQVAEGTTADQVLEFLQSEEGPPPSWLLPGTLETGSLSPGRSMTVDYDLPGGQYVVLCFFPDPKMGGMPHAMMGMIKMIHLM
jgi:hypothetical protein